MTPSREIILQTVYKALDELNEQLPRDQRLEKSPAALLFGKTGPLDSLGLVNLIVAAEQHLEEDLGISVSLADEESMSQHQNPFASVSSLVEYAAALVAARQHEHA